MAPKTVYIPQSVVAGTLFVVILIRLQLRYVIMHKTSPITRYGKIATLDGTEDCVHPTVIGGRHTVCSEIKKTAVKVFYHAQDFSYHTLGQDCNTRWHRRPVYIPQSLVAGTLFVVKLI